MSVAKLLTNLGSVGWQPGLSEQSYESIVSAGFRGENGVLAAVASEIALDCQPITLRGLFYRVVSAGLLPDTSAQHYKRLGRVVTRLRRAGIISYRWIVDNLRSTHKPSSWSGLEDFAEVVRTSYRKDFWAHMPHYVHVFCEKDAIAGVIEPVTNEYDVRLSPIRGYCSESFAHEIGSQWRRIEKPIFAYYLGDYDPSGFDIERDVESKLREHAGREEILWRRLALNESDFADHQLIELPPKKSDRRYARFAKVHGSRCAEVDALPPQEIRRRVETAITRFIPQDEWDRLKHVEELERESFSSALTVATGGGQ